jgi:hypothetical protein
MLQMQPTKQKTNLKTKEPWGARSRGVLLYAPTLMSGLGVTLVAHTHLKGSVWSTSRVHQLTGDFPLSFFSSS